MRRGREERSMVRHKLKETKGSPNARRLPAWKSSISCRSPCSICRTSATSAMKVWCWTGRSICRASTPDHDLGPDLIIPNLPSLPLEAAFLCMLGVPLLGGEGSRGKEVAGEELVKRFWGVALDPSVGCLSLPMVH